MYLASYVQIMIGWKKGASCPLLVCKKTYSTGYSQAVTHPSTNPAQCCLTSVIRREPVHSAWYGHRTMQHLHRHLLYRQCWDFGGKQLKTLECICHLMYRLRLNGKRGHLAHCRYAKRPTALGIPRRSPIQVLTQPNAA